MSDYAELFVTSNYSFLRGASAPDELVARADELGYRAIAITDECSLSGMVRAWQESRERAIHLVVGSAFQLVHPDRVPPDRGGGLKLILLATDRVGYGNLCRIITHARRQAEKGEYRLTLDDLEDLPREGCLAIWPLHTRAQISRAGKSRAGKPRAGRWRRCFLTDSGSASISIVPGVTGFCWIMARRWPPPWACLAPPAAMC